MHLFRQCFNMLNIKKLILLQQLKVTKNSGNENLTISIV